MLKKRLMPLLLLLLLLLLPLMRQAHQPGSEPRRSRTGPGANQHGNDSRRA